MADPAISAVILVRDGEAHIAAAIESVLEQTCPCEQVIVVDNGSTDRSGEIARGYSPAVTVVFEPEHGISAARNSGLAAASGDFIAFLDGDDTWEPQKTELQLAAFDRDDPPDLVFGHVRQFLDSELSPEVAAQVRLPSEPQPGMYLGAMLAPRRVWDLVGPWERHWDAADGLVWFVRARSLELREEMLPEVVTNRRIHGANTSMRNQDKRTEFARLLKASLDERRAARRG